MMIKIFLIILIFCVVKLRNVHGRNDCRPSKTTASGTHVPAQICSGSLIFEDNFSTLDLRKWQHEQTLSGGGNWEFQWYTNNRSNSYVENGILHIRPTFVSDEFGLDFLYSGTLNINGGTPGDSCTDPRDYGCIRIGSKAQIVNPIKSACLRSLYSFAFTYGKLEIRAKLPVGDWLWPALWLLPKWNDYSNWPASGEIDLMESRGNRHYTDQASINVGVQQISSTLIFGPNRNYNRGNYTHFEKNLQKGYNVDFHRYQFEWTPDNFTFSVDDEVLGTVIPTDKGFWELGHLQDSGMDNPWKRSSKMAPFDQEFFIILNLAVGGTTFFQESNTNMPEGKPWSNDDVKHAQTQFWEGKQQWLPTWNLTTDDTHLQIDYVRVWAL